MIVGKRLWDDCNIQEERLDEANDTHQEVYDSVVNESTSTDDENCHDHEKEVHEEQDTLEQNLTYLLELKEVEIGELQIVKEQLAQANTNNRKRYAL